jgi:hypothetical protein
MGAGWLLCKSPRTRRASHLHAGLPAPKVGGGTQVAEPRILSVPLNDPAISHTGIDTGSTHMFKVFLLFFIPRLSYSAGLKPVAPPVLRLRFLRMPYRRLSDY